jgi:hypothetical protein
LVLMEVAQDNHLPRKGLMDLTTAAENVLALLAAGLEPHRRCYRRLGNPRDILTYIDHVMLTEYELLYCEDFHTRKPLPKAFGRVVTSIGQ